MGLTQDARLGLIYYGLRAVFKVYWVVMEEWSSYTSFINTYEVDILELFMAFMIESIFKIYLIVYIHGSHSG